MLIKTLSFRQDGSLLSSPAIDKLLPFELFLLVLIIKHKFMADNAPINTIETQ